VTLSISKADFSSCWLFLNPKYALGMHILPGGLTKTSPGDGFVKVNLDNENHQTGYLLS
jgi:hypothetical protein